MYYFLIFYLGSIVGSFLNVCIHRLPRDESIVSPPSHCPRCAAPIRPCDNIPILSYLILRGRCRGCGERISPRYLIVELVTSAAFLSLAIFYASSTALAIIYIVFACTLIVVFFSDLELQIIPDEVSVGGIIFALAASLAYPALHQASSPGVSIGRSLVGLATGGGVFWLIRIAGRRVFRKEAMGFGDVKLMAYVGALLGWKLVLLTTFLAALIGSVAGAVLMAAGRADLGSRLPFGPFLCIGSVVSLVAGGRLISWYVGLFH